MKIISNLLVTEKSNHLVEYLASFIEISFGFLLTIILYSPIGSFNLNACYTSRQIRKNIGRQFYIFWRRIRLYIILVGYWYLVPNVNRDSYFNPFQSNGLDAEDCLYEVVYPRFSIILCSIRKISKIQNKKFFGDFEKKSNFYPWNWKTEKFWEYQLHMVFENFKVFRLSSQYSVIQLPFIFGIAKIKNITIACLIITNHFRHGS